MSGNYKVATVFGGTGFIGSQIVRELAALGYMVKVATRVPERAFFLKPCGAVGQVTPVAVDYNDESSIDEAVKGSDYVVYSIGLLFRKRRGDFKKAHTLFPEIVARACKKHKVARFVLLSSLGVDKASSKYAKTKLEGEQAVKKAFPAVTILRPSTVFGPGDSFLNMFAELSRYLPFLPLIGGGQTKMQPVFVGDVADAAIKCLTESDSAKVEGVLFELGGPETLTFKELYKRLEQYTGRSRCLMSLPWGIAKIQAGFMSLLPKPPLTPDQVETLKTDSIVSGKFPGFADLGIEPTVMDAVCPDYLECYKSGGRFAEKKRA